MHARDNERYSISFPRYGALIDGRMVIATKENIDGQLRRIIYEVYANPDAQWIKTSNYNISFLEFTKSTSSPDYLARAFVYNYERPSAQYRREEIRADNAEYWYNTLT